MPDTMPENYDPSQFDRPSVTTDILVFTLRDNRLQVLLIQRGAWPFEGQWALPGGFVKMDESLDEAARRELREETGVSDVFVEQLRAFGQPGRDPRTRVITVAYTALVPSDRLVLRADTDAADARWFPLDALPHPLAFDHAVILEAGIHSLRARLEHSPLARGLLPARFTLTQMQSVYEILLGRELDKRNFRKEILGANLVRPTGAALRGPHRPASFYEFFS